MQETRFKVKGKRLEAKNQRQKAYGKRLKAKNKINRGSGYGRER